MGDTMIVVHALLLIVYLGAILVIAMVLSRLGRQVPLGSLMTSALITFLVAQVPVAVCVFLVESNPSYWWYGDDMRTNSLIVVTGLLSLAVLVAGPIVGYRLAGRHHRNQQPESDQ